MALVAVMAGPVQTAGAATGGSTNGRIAFSMVSDNGAPQVFTMSPDGTDVRQLTHSGPNGAAYQASWSADGSTIAYARVGPSGDADIHLIRADGSHDRSLLRDPLFGDFEPSFAPDGRMIVFTRCRPPGGPCTLYTIHTDGTRLRDLIPFSQDGADVQGNYSPDGGSLVDSRGYQGGKLETVTVMAADGSGQHSITPGRLTAAGPEWSPDGTTITFYSHCCDPRISGIWTVRPDGSGLTRLTRPNHNHDFGPTFSPDGSQIAFEQDSPDYSSFGIWVMNADGTGATEILENGWNAEWSPAGVTP